MLESCRASRYGVEQFCLLKRISAVARAVPALSRAGSGLRDPSLVISGGNSSTLHIIRQGLWPGSGQAMSAIFASGKAPFSDGILLIRHPPRLLPRCVPPAGEVLKCRINQRPGPAAPGIGGPGQARSGNREHQAHPGRYGSERDYQRSRGGGCHGGPHVEVGSVLAFAVDYWALLALCTSPYVIKRHFVNIAVKEIL